ncbi:LLM class flavin-dependent oxidoreductase [Sphingomonas sp. 28-63-12]|uniref:LLM class flavin-dependent oxidoreductase n=1 Tax=Sphingomonas sp. 28-63-12 TaxID=1970434 RepID=UPI000BD188C1|nr:MAG: oxidoreductase [Sphingomonas sp. 28-63-12]
MGGARKAIWAQLPPLPAANLAELVRGYENAGLAGIWSPQLFGSPFSTLAAAAMVSDKLQLGTGIALAFTRSPLETACDALDLDIISNGRCVLGLGSSAESQITGSFGSTYGKPLAHMREVVAIIRAVVEHGHSGTLTTLGGDYHTLDLRRFRTLAAPVRDAIPIYLPAVFGKACAQAGEIVDGLLGHPLWNDHWIRNCVPVHLKTGLDRSGRDRQALALNLMVFTVINADKAEGIEDARATIAYYSQSAQYLPYFDAIGFGTEARAIQAAFAANDFIAMAVACSDAMVESIALVGPADMVRARMAQRSATADAITPVIPHFGLSHDKTAFYTNAIADNFYG